jgi:dTDP-4-dehydrorhamnose 3,5-epimerase
MHQIIFNKKINDNRGFFLKVLDTLSISESFMTYSLPNTFRGFHFYGKNNASTRALHILEGKIVDVLIDLRKEYYGKIYELNLNSDEVNTVILPSYCAHGFYSQEGAKLIYFFEKKYIQSEDLCINYKSFDEFHFIKDYLISDRDKGAENLDFFKKKYFNY